MRKMISALFSMLLMMSILGATTYKNKQWITDIEATIPSSGAIISFTLPQGKYPSDSKAVIYAEKGVFCPADGFTPPTKNPTDNPFTLLGEYKFSKEDLKTLESGATAFRATMKFDPECGDIKVQVIGTDDKADTTIQDPNRPTGPTTGTDGKDLPKFTSGMFLEAQMGLSGTALKVAAPEGSYTIGDFLIVFNDKTPIAKKHLKEEDVNALADGGKEYTFIIEGLESTTGLRVMISDQDYEIGGEIEDLEDEKPAPSEDGGAMPMIFIGLGLVVLVGGAGALYYVKKNPAKKA